MPQFKNPRFLVRINSIVIPSKCAGETERSFLLLLLRARKSIPEIDRVLG
jgi:hypothetical protein